MASNLDAPFEILSGPSMGGRRICYSCGTSYPKSVRFCPRDSADLEYAPPPIENLAHDMRRPHNWVAASLILGVATILLGLMLLVQERPSISSSYSVGELAIRTFPAGALVYLDGSQIGVTPMRMADIPAGRHEVRAVFPGYQEGKAQVTIVPSATQKLVWDLSPIAVPKSQNRHLAANPSPENGSAARTSSVKRS